VTAPPRRFLYPWKLIQNDESFEVTDAAGVHLAYVYFEKDPEWRQVMHRLSKAEARRLAAQIVGLQEIVRDNPETGET
jgi:hypothetical protein